MLNIDAIRSTTLATKPYRWGALSGLFSPEDARALASTYPKDHLKRISRVGKRQYDYLARSLIHMGAKELSFVDELSSAWRSFADTLLSPEYRQAMAKISGLDLTDAPLEVNVMHYSSGAHLDVHVDHPTKILTQVFYFNTTWDSANGGCINILRSQNPDDVEAVVLPIIGNSVILVRSEDSWHSVPRVSAGCSESRRSVNVIFNLPGSISTMWTPGKEHELASYDDHMAAAA